MPPLLIRPRQFALMGLAAYSARLHQFMTRHVKTPAPVEPEALMALLHKGRPLAGRCGFGSEADLALFTIANLCLPEKAEAGELKAFLADPQMTTNEKRYQLSAELDRGGFMPFGALEADAEA